MTLEYIFKIFKILKEISKCQLKFYKFQFTQFKWNFRYFEYEIEFPIFLYIIRSGYIEF